MAFSEEKHDIIFSNYYVFNVIKYMKIDGILLQNTMYLSSSLENPTLYDDNLD
jgi:hypothetical protein